MDKKRGLPANLEAICGSDVNHLPIASFLNSGLVKSNLPPRDLATRVLAEVELIPQFARGGLARILDV